MYILHVHIIIMETESLHIYDLLDNNCNTCFFWRGLDLFSFDFTHVSSDCTVPIS